jgi:DNA-binding NtrC family response regulator
VRVFAAPHRDLPVAVERGTFRADLYYRLAVATLRVPPLRERPEDVPVLVDHFLAELGAPAGLRLRWTSAETRRALLRAPWPGNVRELRNAVERSLVMDVDPLTEASVAPTEPAPPAGPRTYDDARARALAAFERDYVRELLTAADGNISQAARLAGLSRTYMHRLMARHGIARGSWHLPHAGGPAAP